MTRRPLFLPTTCAAIDSFRQVRCSPRRLPLPLPMPLWLYWILLGLIAGSLAKWILPGRDPAGCLFTIFLGILGALLGGLIGSYVGWGEVTQGQLDLRSIGIATVGAIVVLVIGRLVRALFRIR
jgi:uncharacterized membrane protein YeaQ/YmgE (transglycosylase-associated protein family)